MAINVNKINQNNNYNIGNQNIPVDYSSLKIAETVQGTGEFGKLIPIKVQEVLPSQKINLNQEIALQFMPFVSNLMSEINGEIMYYAVPNRLMWDEWDDFIIGGADGKDTKVVPTMDLLALKKNSNQVDKDGNPTLIGTLADCFGMPVMDGITRETTDENAPKPIKFPWRAYNLIYNEHIRLPDLEAEEIDLDNNEILTGNWDWDYFTRSRKYQYRGIDVSVPINDTLGQLTHNYINTDGSGNVIENGTRVSIDYATMITEDNKNTYGAPYGEGQINAFAQILPNHNLDQLGIEINDFMTSLSIMRYQTNNAKIEPRVTEFLQARYGIYPQDSRMNRPEYLGSKYFNIATETVTQTGGDTETSKQGQITGQAWGSGVTNCEYEAKEWCILMAIMIIRPKSVYEGGLNRQWIKKTKFDYATNELVNLPDREIYKGELKYTGTVADNEGFGWQGMYEEYRTATNSVTGLLRPSIADGLKTYTLARYWDTDTPKLNKEFVQCNPDSERIKQFTDEPLFVYFVRSNLTTAIPLPLQSEPLDMNFI